MSLSRPSMRPFAVALLALGLVLGLVPATAAPAEAATSSATASAALRAALSKQGAPYQWGAEGPYRFDCSGLVQWSYGRAGKAVPRTSRQQYAASTRVSRSQARPGDLVFFVSSSGSVYHVGLYAGNGYVVDSPKPGRVVSKRKIWTSSVRFGQLR